MNTAFLQAVNDRKLAHDLRQIADDFEILDFFKQHGACSFTMSTLLVRVLTEKGYCARGQGCYVEVKQNNSVFYLGYKGFAHDRQREGHAVCVVEEQYLLDFGLGAMSKLYAEDFSHALACEISADVQTLGSLDLDGSARITWRTDWISPMVAQELQAQLSQAESLLAIYNDFQKNRMAYLLQKLFAHEEHLLPEKSQHPG